MDPRERDAVHAALRRMAEDTVFPYSRVTTALARYEQQQKAEREWWRQFLPGHSGASSTRAIDPPGPRQVTVAYGPDVAGALAPGEIVRTWLPPVGDGVGRYDEALIVAPESSGRFYAVSLASTSRDGSRRYFPIGAGPRNDCGRYSWVDLDHVFSVDAEGVRRAAFTMDRPHFLRIADELYGRYGWQMAD